MSSYNICFIILNIAIYFHTVRASCSTTDGKKCSFPFKYNGEMYNKCTNADTGSQYWCATSTDSNKNVVEKGNCAQQGCERTTTPSPTVCQATTGKECVFPFTYKGKQYSECTTAKREEAGITKWCATSVNDNGEVQGFGNCYECSCVKNCMTTAGSQCIFPFIYKGVHYYGCTNSDYGSTYWCPTSTYINGYAKGYGTCSKECRKEDNPPDTECQTKSRQKCIFPFNYDGKTYDACTNVDYPVKWCATSLTNTGNYEGSGACTAACNN